jgi:hypothetical protein
MTEKTKRRQAALDVANQARAALGLPPVDHLYKGRPSDPYSCAMTQTVYDDDLDRTKYIVTTGIGAVVVKHRILETEVVRVLHTPDSRAFVKRFDRREYPTLIRGIGHNE